MGCCGSSGQNNNYPGNVTTPRRRLSVGNVDANQQESSSDVGEENRGLMKSLDEEAILNMITDADNGRKMSIGSTTDAGKTSFIEKTQKQEGDEEIDLTGLGWTCRKGLKPESPNQDSWSLLKVPGDFSIYAVFDGHGQKGHDVSNFVKDNLPKLILKDQRFKSDEMPTMLTDCFKKMQNFISSADRMKKLSAQMSGTTATVVVHNEKKRQLTVSHVADSSAVLGRRNPDTKKMEAVQITRDHKPNLKDERARIEKNGGRVVFDGYANHRIYARNARYPGLNMSRCLGDLMGHSDCGIIAEPEVKVLDINDSDRVLLVCSDGVWEFISPQQAVEIVADFLPGNQAMQAAETLAKEAWNKWITEEGGAVVDDITVVCVFLNQPKKGNEP
mmetsp:Transcript_99454/g.222949  ORF Transcript_99454/g.222949 Transcript_99454/m.222949 type:complete len:388 (-) Transcript_99454:292-1455(-)